MNGDTKAAVLARKRVHQLAKTGRLAEMREATGLSQVDVAKFLGVTQPSVWRWENGRIRPTPERAVALLHLLEEA